MVVCQADDGCGLPFFAREKFSEIESEREKRIFAASVVSTKMPFLRSDFVSVHIFAKGAGLLSVQRESALCGRDGMQQVWKTAG